MVWQSNLCTFLLGIFTISWYQTVLWLRWAKALDGVVVECVNHMISVSLHSAAGGDVFTQAAPSLLPQRVLYLYIVCPWKEDTTGMKSCILLWCQNCQTLDECDRIKGTVPSENKIRSSFTYPHVLPTSHALCSSYSERHWLWAKSSSEYIWFKSDQIGSNKAIFCAVYRNAFNISEKIPKSLQGITELFFDLWFWFHV